MKRQNLDKELILRSLQFPLVKELIDKEVPFEVTKEGIRLGGFYKSGTLLLVPLNDSSELFTALDRYDADDLIRDFTDILSIQLHWFRDSETRWEGKQSPDPIWEKHLIEYGLLKKVTETVTRYE